MLLENQNKNDVQNERRDLTLLITKTIVCSILDKLFPKVVLSKSGGLLEKTFQYFDEDKCNKYMQSKMGVVKQFEHFATSLNEDTQKEMMDELCKHIKLVISLELLKEMETLIRKISQRIEMFFDSLEFIILIRYLEVIRNKDNVSPEVKQKISQVFKYLSDNDFEVKEEKHTLYNILYTYFSTHPDEAEKIKVLKDLIYATLIAAKNPDVLKVFYKNKAEYTYRLYIKVFDASIDAAVNPKSKINKFMVNILSDRIFKILEKKYKPCFDDQLDKADKLKIKELIKEDLINFFQDPEKRKSLSDSVKSNPNVSEIIKYVDENTHNTVLKRLNAMQNNEERLIQFERNVIESNYSEIDKKIEKRIKAIERFVTIAIKVIVGMALALVTLGLTVALAKILGASVSEVKHPFNVKTIWKLISDIPSFGIKALAIFIWILTLITSLVLIIKIGKGFVELIMKFLSKK